MGRRGPKPTPTVTLKLRGSKDVVGRRSGEASPPAGVPKPPCWLSAEEQEVWPEIIATLVQVPGLLTVSDGILLGLICEATCDFRDARTEIDNEGSTCCSDKGGKYQHPAVGRKNAAIERLSKFCKEFGMSPASRASVKVAPARPEETSKKKFFA